ncbi:MAG TPA: ABC transporter permease [Candidatus Pacearchaeota archaeon]|nr:macrolide export ATP-binding/permease protein MacB [archaeon BMS3Abin17]HDK42211.1 ABC transporter permease [Candidatus Pacearchaeota archaeon]HDZ61069.1 ABC transporter permease [Candidatus Pacearchaeota archaeon]
MDYFLFAFKNLKRRGIRSWLTLIGIFIGVTAVISLIILGNGLKLAVANQFGISSTEVITVQAGGLNEYGPPGTAVVNPLTVDDVREIGKLSSVDLAVRRNIATVKLEFNDNIIFSTAASIPDREKRKFVYEVIGVEAEAGRLLKDGDTNKVVLGNNFYTDKAGLGKKIVPGNKILIQNKKFEVIGIIEKKGSFIFDNVVMMNDNALEKLMNYGDEVDIIAVKVKDKDLMDKAKEDIKGVLRRTRNVKKGEEDFEVETPEAMLADVNNILGGVQIFVIIIASISIIVGAIGIVNTMTASVLERRKEIGIMKAIGARNSQIFYQFFVESGLLGLVGGLVGIIFGIFIGFLGIVGLNTYMGSDVLLDFNLPLIVFSLIGSFLIGGVSGIIPAMRAAKQNPVEALG